jgi:hypothetical protein
MKLKIKFMTNRPLTQTEGMEMWRMGSSFAAVPGGAGRSVYVLHTEGMATSPPNLTGTLDAAASAIAAVLHGVEQIIVVGVEAELEDSELPQRVTSTKLVTGG